jgi:hypothetical protein
MSSVAGCFSVLVLVACASACVRDDWTYDARVDVNATEVTADVTSDVPVLDVPVLDVPVLDVPVLDVPVLDVPVLDASTDVPAIDAFATDAFATDVPATDVPATDVPSDRRPSDRRPCVRRRPRSDVPATDVPAIDVPAIDVPAIDVPVIDAATDVPAVDARADAAVDAPAPTLSGVAPRPIAPISLGDVTQRRPTLRWQLPSGFDGAVVELCRDRACTMVIETRTVSGSSTQPTADLPARSVVFWRLRGRRGATTDAAYSPTWLFHVPATSASAGWTRAPTRTSTSTATASTTSSSRRSGPPCGRSRRWAS